MADVLTVKPIAYMQSDFPQKFGIPRQSGLVQELQATVRLLPEYSKEQALRGLCDFSHLWLLWGFSLVDTAEWSPTVRPPRLGGNTKMGVFATRSPYRPNSIGLSCVRLEGIEKQDDCIVLCVSGADLADGTPIYDIKPYIPYTDSRPDAVGGFSDAVYDHALQVEIPEALLEKVAPDKRQALIGILAQDPRPQYQQDPERIYGLSFAQMEIHFCVKGNQLTVLDIVKNNE